MTNQEAIEELKARKEHYEMGDGCEFLVEALDKGIEALEKQKTGHWMNRQSDFKAQVYYTCSVCNSLIKTGKYSNFFKYCPNCGAEMENKQ